MQAFGFSLNNLTLFGLVLAIGIVVDDAIVVVENVERYLQRRALAQGSRAQDHGRGRRRAARHRAGALRGVHPDRVHRRNLRRVLQAVRADDRDLDDHFVLRVADAVAGARRAAAQAAQPRGAPRHLEDDRSAARYVLRGLQPRRSTRCRRPMPG